MAAWRLVYSATSRQQAGSLHPSIKAVVEQRIEELSKDPYLGKPLERELSGYYSCKAKRFRIVYRIDPSSQMVQIHYVGHRKDVYELLREMLAEKHRADNER